MLKLKFDLADPFKIFPELVKTMQGLENCSAIFEAIMPIIPSDIYGS